MGASQDITLLTPNAEADRAFLYRTLISNATLLQQRSRGTTIQGVSREDIDSLPILLPPLPEQRAIAAMLDSIDDAIERTHAVITTTEQLRDSLLHELLTRGVPGWHTEWKNVPGLGAMPADWEVVRLGDVAEIVMGQSPPGGKCNRVEDGVPLLNGPTEFGPYYPTPVQWTTDPKKGAGVGDILFCVPRGDCGTHELVRSRLCHWAWDRFFEAQRRTSLSKIPASRYRFQAGRTPDSGYWINLSKSKLRPDNAIASAKSSQL